MGPSTFYDQLFAPLSNLGALDPESPLATDPFDPTGDLTLSRFAAKQGRFSTFVSSGLAIGPEQKRSDGGRYELLFSSDDEGWVREVATDVARMSFDVRFSGGHTFDLTSWAFETDTLQGLLFEEAYRVRIDGESYGVLRCIGITRRELAFVRAHGARPLLDRLRAEGIYPHCDRIRRSVVAPGAEVARSPLPSGTMGSVHAHAVQDLDLSFVRGISGHQGVSAVTVLGRDFDEMNTEAIWFRLDVRLEGEVGLVQIQVPVRDRGVAGPPTLRVAWHEGIVFPPYDGLLGGGSRPVPEAGPLMSGLYSRHVSRADATGLSGRRPSVGGPRAAKRARSGGRSS